MKIYELLEAKPALTGFDTEHYGIWTVEMSRVPVLMPAYTGNSRQFVAKVTDKRTDKHYIAAGSSQAEAREAAIAKGMQDLNQGLSDDPIDYNAYTLDFNVDFSREFHNPAASRWFKFVREGDQLFLVRANIKYVSAFGAEMRELDFHQAVVRTEHAGYELTHPHLQFHLNRQEIISAGLRVNQRYTVHSESGHELDDDGNELFTVVPHSRIQVRGHSERMRVPGFTISASEK